LSEVEYARRAISGAELANTIAYLESKRASIARRIGDSVDRLDGPRQLMTEIHPVLNEMFEFLPAMGLEWQKASRRRFHELGLGPLPSIKIIVEQQAGFGARATPTDGEEEEYFKALDAEYRHYAQIYNQLYRQVAQYKYYAVSPRRQLADRLKQEERRAERLADRIGALDQGQTISTIRNEVCCIHAVLRYLEFMISMAEGVETSIVNVEVMHEREDESFLALDIVPLNFGRIGHEVAGWFGTVENVQRLADALVAKFLAHKTPHSMDNCTALDLLSKAGIFDQLDALEKDGQLERADIKAANDRYNRAVDIAELGANIIAEAALFIGSMGVGNVARASVRGVRAIGGAIVAGSRRSLTAALDSVASARAAIRKARAQLGNLAGFSYRELWRAKNALAATGRGLRTLGTEVGRFFYDPRSWSAISREYWERRRPADGRSLHHWLLRKTPGKVPDNAGVIRRLLAGVPQGVRNAGWNRLEMGPMHWLHHHPTLGLNEYMGLAPNWRGVARAADRARAGVYENVIRVGVPTVAGAGGYAAFEVTRRVASLGEEELAGLLGALSDDELAALAGVMEAEQPPEAPAR
jgi:hypothetical protein